MLRHTEQECEKLELDCVPERDCSSETPSVDTEDLIPDTSRPLHVAQLKSCFARKRDAKRNSHWQPEFKLAEAIVSKEARIAPSGKRLNVERAKTRFAELTGMGGYTSQEIAVSKQAGRCLIRPD